MAESRGPAVDQTTIELNSREDHGEVQLTANFDALIIAGGAGRRIGGIDKSLIEIEGAPMLARVLAEVDRAERTVVVGPVRAGIATNRPIRWCPEEPPGGGPAAGLAAGLLEVRAEVVVVLAVDLPWIAPAVSVLRCRLASGPPVDAAVLVDPDGRPNYLAAAWRRTALTDAVSALDWVVGAPMRSLYDLARWVALPDRHGWGRAIDTPGDLPLGRPL
jgi:molybdopterin-guanine dinucleotide biosynthesis protein A